jgi:hypothetical protein
MWVAKLSCLGGWIVQLTLLDFCLFFPFFKMLGIKPRA